MRRDLLGIALWVGLAAGLAAVYLGTGAGPRLKPLMVAGLVVSTGCPAALAGRASARARKAAASAGVAWQALRMARENAGSVARCESRVRGVLATMQLAEGGGVPPRADDPTAPQPGLRVVRDKAAG